MSKETLTKSIREIPDFPIPGILFYDVTTLFKEPAALQELSDTLYEMYKDKGITKVVGIESRGFIMGPILATRLGAGFVPIRKPGKLPAETIEESYDKEYGKDTVQMHKDAINEDDVVLLHDDLLATGGTMEAACKLVKQMSPKKVYVNFIIELKELHGKDVFGDDVEVESVLSLYICQTKRHRVTEYSYLRVDVIHHFTPLILHLFIIPLWKNSELTTTSKGLYPTFPKVPVFTNI